MIGETRWTMTVICTKRKANPYFSGLLAICGPSSYSSYRTAGSDYRVPVLWWRDTRPEVAVPCLDFCRPRLRSVRGESEGGRTVVMAPALAAPALGLQWFDALSGSAIVADLLCLTVAAFGGERLGLRSWFRTGHRRQAVCGRRRLHPDAVAVDRPLRVGRPSRPGFLQRQRDQRLA